MLLNNSRSGAWNAVVPTTTRERMAGLLGTDGLAPGDAFLIPRCRSVHTFGMRFTIVVAFLDADMRVVSVRRMLPGRLALPRLRVRHVLECPDGADILAGDQLYESPSHQWPRRGAVAHVYPHPRRESA